MGCNNANTGSYFPVFSGTQGNKRVYASDMRASTASTAFDTDYRRGGFYNWRERKWMLLLNINVSDLRRQYNK